MYLCYSGLGEGKRFKSRQKPPGKRAKSQIKEIKMVGLVTEMARRTTTIQRPPMTCYQVASDKRVANTLRGSWQQVGNKIETNCGLVATATTRGSYEWHWFRGICLLKLEFRDADTDTDNLARILARMSVSVSASWHASLKPLHTTQLDGRAASCRAV